MTDENEDLDLSMKLWWGWGHEADYDLFKEHPNFWNWAKSEEVLNITEEIPLEVILKDAIQMPPPKVRPEIIAALNEKLQKRQVAEDFDTRLRHCYGKSLRDLLRMRTGDVKHPPDVVVFPMSEQDVIEIVRIANEYDSVVIPFGGGTNIVGSVEANYGSRFVICVDMKQMSRVLEIDEESLTATIEAGVLGPHLEEQLNAVGYALGHHPDSFKFSTLGGWVATRSAGQQSDAYGKIEDMLLSLKMVTANGTLVTRRTPASSIGPDLNELIAGSEGIYGIITELTMRIHPYPEMSEDHAVLFKDFTSGLHFVRAIVQGDDRPDMIRFLNEDTTAMSFALSKPSKGIKGVVKKLLKRALALKGYERPCLMILGFEGSCDHAKQVRDRTLLLCKKKEGFVLGKKAAAEWRAKRYLVPVVRDAMLNQGVIGDVAETSASWSDIPVLYQAVRNAVLLAADRVGHKTWVGCHISHTYKTGCSLYFTFASQCDPKRAIDQYDILKSAATNAVVRHKGALSHHHAIGIEHQPWIRDEIGVVGIQALNGVKHALDPANIFNPGKLVPDDTKNRPV